MSSLDRRRPSVGRRGAAMKGAGLVCIFAAGLCVSTAHATLPPWMQHVVGASTIEAALYRVMTLPSVQALYPRPPKESQAELARLIATTPADGELYGLRARADESSLDFVGAESDWKLYAAKAKDPVEAKVELADFYQRRLQVPQEIATLREIAGAPSLAPERFTNPNQQRSWQTYERIFAVINDQGLAPSEARSTYEAFLARYPDQPLVYARYFQFLLDQKDYPAGEALIARFHTEFPRDTAFPIRARALLEYRRGNINKALDVYDQAFQPLWPADLVQSYFALLTEAHRQRAFVANARDRLARHPDGPEGLNALARIFYYEQQQGRLDAAQQAVDVFRNGRESRNGAWTADDLYTLAALTNSIHSYPEAARYGYALASTSGTLPNGELAAQSGLAGLVDLLLKAPDQPIALGAGNLTLYRDIATLDQGPGYWNGILSLWLNGTSPQTEYNAETAKSQSYFHRAKAAELLGQLDQKFPAAAERAGLHVQLVRVYAEYGESEAVISAGKEYLAAFPASPAATGERVEIANLMADAYSRRKRTGEEFALYDFMLAELSAQTGGMPLSAATVGQPAKPAEPVQPADSSEEDGEEDSANGGSAKTTVKTPTLDLGGYTTAAPSNPSANAYATLLDRYIGRLVAEKQLPQALAVLRHQLELSPNDPRLYERLAGFLEENNFSAQQEEVFKAAFARFQRPTWYDKLARLYLRERKREAYAALTRQVTGIFSGTELDAWFAQAGSLKELNGSSPGQRSVGAQLALQLNLYAEKRFPHDLVFTRNLLNAYQAVPTRNAAAYESLLRRHWWEDEQLRGEFFDYLARMGKLQAEIAQLQALATNADTTNPAAARELAEASIWNSHFEAAAPLMGRVADLYPADFEVGNRAVSLFRSLSYLDSTPASLERAVAIENHLSAADPSDADRLATLGDLYAEATSSGGEDLRAAAPYWHRIPALQPGSPAGYLTSATIFWDYFQFGPALAEVHAARDRFHQPTLYGYEAGAIEENSGDLPAAIADYTAVVTDPPGDAVFLASVDAAVGALLKPPSDEADSNLQSTAQSLFNSSESRLRLLQLAIRPASAVLVNQATAKAVAAAPTPAALMLRADVLIAQHQSSELVPLLDQALARAKTAEEAAAIGQLARSHSSSMANDSAHLSEVDVTLGAAQTAANRKVSRKYSPSAGYSLNDVYEHSIARQIALTSDPVEKIQLNYTLAASLEGRKDIQGATRITDEVYRANPRILGVVRATTDFYARTNQPPRAVATLLEAAKVATPGLARNFTLEAAQKANAANDTGQARGLAMTLLPANPYDAQVLGVIADSYARAHDDVGLKGFYEAHLNTVKTAALTPDERKQDTALLRRGLIPALTRLKDYEGAVNQYIALLSSYPEDTATAQQAALYALRYDRKPQLVEFLRTTVQQSPKDSRFAILLAQVDTTFEDLPGALAAYNAAIAIRKDRADLYQSRVDLELRLGLSEPPQLEAAAADFDRLYVLTYKDPVWMVRLAELRARQRRPADAVKALQTAYIAGHPPAAADSFSVASQLAEWSLLAEARTFAEQGVTLAGADLLVLKEPYGNINGPKLYAEILTRLGKPDAALSALSAARRAIDLHVNYPVDLADQLEAQGISADDQASQRRAYLKQRQESADAQLSEAVTAIGAVVRRYYTPEQKLAYAQVLDHMHDAAQPGSNIALALTAATSAGLTDREAAWRKQLLLTGPIKSADAQREPYIALQQSRLAEGELAQTLEAYAARVRKPETASTILQQAAQAWRDAGDQTDELRLTRTLALRNNASVRDRFFDLLLRHDRAALAALASNNNTSLADAAVNYTVAHTDLATSLQAVEARGRTLQPVWRPASASLVLTYYASDNKPAPILDFTLALNSNATIADRLGAAADPAKQLTGDIWFYYASRFGIFLASAPKAATVPDEEDYLPAELEGAPTIPAGYVHLAQTYDEAGNFPAAVGEYNHALELAPGDIDIHNGFATMLYPEHGRPEATRRDQAIAQWRASLTVLRKMQDRNEYPEGFYTGLKTTLEELGGRALTAALRPEIEAILRPYFGRNGNYRSNELLQAAYEACATPSEGVAFILSISSTANDQETLLADLERASWLTARDEQQILLRRLQLVQAKPSMVDTGGSGSGSGDRIATIERALLQSYVAQGQDAQAQALLDTIPAKQRNEDPQIQAAMIVLAAHGGRLPALVDTYRASSDTAPAPDVLTNAAKSLARPPAPGKPDYVSALLLREFVFDQKQLSNLLGPTDFLALAQLRLDTHDVAGALQLLQRLSLQPGSSAATPMTEDFGPSGVSNSYSNIDSAASLLEASHHAAEALPFLTMLVTSEPWNAVYKLRLAHAERDAGHPETAVKIATEIAADSTAPYAIRSTAALDLKPLNGAGAQFGSVELALLASETPTAAAVRRPYFAEARIAVSASVQISKPERIALLREALAIAPTGSLADHARLSLLQLEADSGNPSVVIAILESLQRTPPASGLNAAEDDETASADTEDSDSSENDTADAPATTVSLPKIAEELDLKARTQLAIMISSVYQRDHQLDSALSYMQLGIQLNEQQGKADPAFVHQRDALEALIELDRRNALRGPIIQAALAQTVQVRPRLALRDLSHAEAP